MVSKHIESPISHPDLYVIRQTSPAMRSNNMAAEIVWTYLVARKYENDQQTLAKKLCGQNEKLPDNSKIWLETYLHPTRIQQAELKYWRTRADLSMGHLELVEDREYQIRSNGDWVCICESKWFDDIHHNARFPIILQFSQIIEHAILLHDKRGNFPDRVYVTLITPRYFKEKLGQFSERLYWEKYRDYTEDKKLLEDDLRLCPLPFLKYDTDMLISRIYALKLRWVTFEELLGLSDLVESCIPGRYRTTRDNWKQVFREMGSEHILRELT
jgi:hypothetical protein